MNYASPSLTEGQVTEPEGQIGDQVSLAGDQVDARVISLLETAAATPASRADLLDAIGMSNKHVRFVRCVQPLIVKAGEQLVTFTLRHPTGISIYRQPDSAANPLP